MKIGNMKNFKHNTICLFCKPFQLAIVCSSNVDTMAFGYGTVAEVAGIVLVDLFYTVEED